MRRAVALLLAVGLVSIPLPVRGLAQEGVSEERLTFTGDAGGGTITITLTQDLSAVTRIALQDVSFPEPCAVTRSTVWHFDPPEPVAGDSFRVSLFPINGITPPINVLEGVGIEATAGPEGVSGTAVFSAGTPMSGAFCISGDVDFIADQPVDTPPSPEDQLFAGTIDDAQGRILLTLDRDGGVTSLALDDVMFSCQDPPVLNVVDFFDPPMAPNTDGGFNLVLSITQAGAESQYEIMSRLVTLSWQVTPEGAIDGSASFSGLFEECFLSDLAWGAQFVPATPTPASTATATAAAPATATPTRGAGPVALPDAGGGARSNGSIGLVAMGLLLGLGGLAAGAARLRVR